MTTVAQFTERVETLCPNLSVKDARREFAQGDWRITLKHEMSAHLPSLEEMPVQLVVNVWYKKTLVAFYGAMDHADNVHLAKWWIMTRYAAENREWEDRKKYEAEGQAIWRKDYPNPKGK